MRNMINLLPVAFRRQQIIRNRAYQWSAVISLVLLAGWASHWYELREQLAVSQRLEGLTREHRPTQLMLHQLVEMRQQLVNLEHQERIASELAHQRNALTLLGAISQTAQKTNGRLRITNLELTNFQSHRDVAPADATNVSPAWLRVEGVSLDNPAVAELLDGLQKSGIFSSVELLALKEREDTQSDFRHYEIRCEF